MSFLINDDKLLEKSNKIWDEVSNIIKELDTEKIQHKILSK